MGKEFLANLEVTNLLQELSLAGMRTVFAALTLHLQMETPSTFAFPRSVQTAQSRFFLSNTECFAPPELVRGCKPFYKRIVTFSKSSFTITNITGIGSIVKLTNFHYWFFIFKFNFCFCAEVNSIIAHGVPNA